MKKIILIYPKTEGIYCTDKNVSLPLSLLNISSFIYDKYDIRIIDQRIDANWKKTLKRELNGNTLCVGITALTGEQIRYALEAVNFVKKVSDTKVVWGGPHATLYPELTIRHPNVDIIVVGEGELAFKEVVQAINQKKSLKNIKGVWYKKGKRIVKTPKRGLLDLNIIPPLPYFLLDVKKYTPKRFNLISGDIETSRGCIFNCSCCLTPFYNDSGWRCLTAENTIKRIEHLLQNLKVEYVYFLDDNFFVNEKRVREISNWLKNKGDVAWEVQGAPIAILKNMNQKYFEELKKSGCIKLSPGVESGSERILKLMNKNITPNQIVKFNRKLAGSEIKLTYNFMGGFPIETEKELKMTIRLIFKLLKENPNAQISPFNMFIPYPNTKSYDLALKKGFKPPQKLGDCIELDRRTSVDKLPWLTEKMKKAIGSLIMTTLFIDDKHENVINSPLVKFVSKLYKPLAIYRTKNFLFDNMIEKKLYDSFKNFS